VLSAVNAVAATAKSSEELFLVARLRSTVAAAAGDTTQACAALRAIRDSVARSEVERIDNRMKTVLFCK